MSNINKPEVTLWIRIGPYFIENAFIHLNHLFNINKNVFPLFKIIGYEELPLGY